MIIVSCRHDDVQHPGHHVLERHLLAVHEPVPPHCLWIDLIEPTREEDRKIEEHLGISIPTREEMSDIEPSETLYAEDGALYMSGRLFTNIDKNQPEMTGVTFILKDDTLITVRYAEPLAFQMFATRAGKTSGCTLSSEGVVTGLIETIIDRAADVLQTVGGQIDAISREVFESDADPAARNAAYQATLRALGRHGDLISKIRECLVSLERIVLFLTVNMHQDRVPLELREEVRNTQRDIKSLEEHANFLSSKIQFILDATLGLVNLEQNNIIKLFSVMAVVFMPPTLIASIYGMNFKSMPELEFSFGYPMALMMMVAAAVLPYVFFRWKKWL
jgi:magnesium transporter